MLYSSFLSRNLNEIERYAESTLLLFTVLANTSAQPRVEYSKMDRTISITLYPIPSILGNILVKDELTVAAFSLAGLSHQAFNYLFRDDLIISIPDNSFIFPEVGDKERLRVTLHKVQFYHS